MELQLHEHLQCHRCLGPLVLTARVPYGFHRADGLAVSGLRGISLCASCDSDDPAAQGILAYFAVNPTVVDDVAFAVLVDEWACRIADRLVLEQIPKEEEPEEL